MTRFGTKMVLVVILMISMGRYTSAGVIYEFVGDQDPTVIAGFTQQHGSSEATTKDGEACRGMIPALIGSETGKNVLSREGIFATNPDLLTNGFVFETRTRLGDNDEGLTSGIDIMTGAKRFSYGARQANVNAAWGGDELPVTDTLTYRGGGAWMDVPGITGAHNEWTDRRITYDPTQKVAQGGLVLYEAQTASIGGWVTVWDGDWNSLDDTTGDYAALLFSPTYRNEVTAPYGITGDDRAWISLVRLCVVSCGPSPTDFIWNAGSGDWNVPGNWNHAGTPGTGEQSSSQTVTFADSIGNESRTVFTDQAVTVNRISFANTMGGSYRIAGGPGINLAASTVMPTVSPSIDVLGPHEFQAPVTLHNSTTVNVASSSTLTFNNTLNLNGQTLTKTGAGEVAINNKLITGGGTVSFLQGTISGVGTIGGDMDNQGGTISPGSSGATSGVPEPSSLLLLLLGGLLLRTWKLGVRNCSA